MWTILSSSYENYPKISKCATVFYEQKHEAGQGVIVKNIRRIQTRLFITYIFIICIVIGVFSIMYYYNVSSVYEQASSETLFQTAQIVSSDLDNLLQTANNLSNRLIYSQELKTLFYSNMYDNSTESLQNRQRFNAKFYDILGPQIPPFQINMFKTNGEFLGMGLNLFVTKISRAEISDTVWLDSCLEADGTKIFAETHENNFLKRPSPVVSVARSFGERWGTKKNSVIEIQIPYEQIVTAVNTQYFQDDLKVKIYVFSPDGQVIYPFDREIPDDILLLPVSAPTGSPKPIDYYNAGIKEVAAYSNVPTSNWQVVVTQSPEIFYRSVYRLGANIIFLVAISLILALFVAHRLAYTLAFPIRQIRDNVALLSLDSLLESSFHMVDSGVDELEELNNAFIEMRTRLETSLEETIAARNMEIHSRMLALQAQMDPHFMYNTLTTISILSENGENEKVCEACDLLSDMLRYLSDGGDRQVTIQQELEHTKGFLNLTKLRFNKKLTVSLNIAEEMYLVKIPRFTLQPLIENCIKHAFWNDPPLIIEVTGIVTETNWRIRVSDNGSGFSEEKLYDLKASLSDAQATQSELSLEGMGLLNIYMRLFLLYDEQTVFEFGNNQNAGAYIELGGLIHGKKI